MNTTHKYLAHFIIEADTPFAIGSGEKGFTVDRLIARDALGLPYIPGSSLAGVLRHELDPMDKSEEVKKLFGFQSNSNGQGSRINFSSAHLIGADGKTVMEGLQDINLKSDYYSYFQKLPERDHVRMNHRGAADTKGHGKFDEELVYKGTRFAFNIELSGDESDQQDWQHVLSLIHQPLFRLGAGTRKGFGKLKVISCMTRIFDLENKSDLLAYLAHSNSLNESLTGWEEIRPEVALSDDWVHYKLNLTPENFFLFGAGYGDEDVDNKPKTERYFDWSSGKPVLAEKDWLLIPATSVKGALSHRVAYHYNLISGNFIGGTQQAPAPPPAADISAIVASTTPPVDVDTLDIRFDSPEWEHVRKKIEAWSLEEALLDSASWQHYENELEKYRTNYKPAEKPVGENNPAVKVLFGYALDSDGSGVRGNVIFSDLYIEPQKEAEKVFSHVSIDRFTGGARDGMLFQQKAVSSDTFILDIYVKKEALSDKNVRAAFEEALIDLCQGDLQLGGGSSKGHGIFKGSIEKTNA
jgi:CRISPR/Cas system CSM-associated protein Csm3 (group 7 of RAMP superfamily)